jgi:hypothetical protein
MNARQRINRLLADWTAFPIGIHDRGVAVTGEYHGYLVCEQPGGSFYESTETVLRRADGLARAMSATALHDTLGANAG